MHCVSKVVSSRVISVLAVSFFVACAFAQASEKIVCKSGPTVRTIEVVYEVEGKSLPCKVNYEKAENDGGSTQGLYSATSQEGFCTEKANELKTRLESGGFSCTAEGGDATPAPEAGTEAPAENSGEAAE